MDTAYRAALRRHYLRIGFAVFVFYLAFILLQLGINAAVTAAAPELTEKGWYLPALSFFPLYCIGFPLFLMVLPPAPKAALLPAKRTVPARELVLILIMCFGILYPGNLLGLGVDWLARSFFGSSGGGNPLEELLGSSGYWAYALLAGVLAPVMEELCFRKLLLDRLRTIDKPSALFFSALTFGLFHSNPVQLFYAFGVGLIFGCIYLRTGRIIYTMILHVLVNFFGGLVSTYILQFVDFSRPGDAILPLAGLGVYAVLVIAAAVAGVVLLIRFRRSLRVADGADLFSPADRLGYAFLNPGFILYFFAAIGVMTLSYFA